MDNDLIKALHCLTSQDNAGDCHMDIYNLLRKDNEPKMYCNNKVWGDETIQCPYHQDEYETCFEDGECGEWLNKIADILEKYEEVKHFFEMEMEHTNERMESLDNPTFNGVEVGYDKQIELNKAHVRFCEQVLKMIGG